jgi:hypothetical protein
MDLAAAENQDLSSTPQQPHANLKQNYSPGFSVDKYAEARSAKKKKRRVAHRARIKRAHANG